MKKEQILLKVCLVLVFICSLFISASPGLTAGDGYFIGMQSKQSFLRIRNKAPNNYAVAYYLGWVYFNEGRFDEAINEWERYLAIAPDDSKSTSIKEHLTFLRFNQAIEYA